MADPLPGVREFTASGTIARSALITEQRTILRTGNSLDLAWRAKVDAHYLRSYLAASCQIYCFTSVVRVLLASQSPRSELTPASRTGGRSHRMSTRRCCSQRAKQLLRRWHRPQD